MTRRGFLAGAALAANTALLLSCGGDDEEDRAPREGPDPRSGAGVALTKEPLQLALAVLDHPLTVTPGQKAIQDWDRGNIPGAPQGTVLQLVKVSMEGGARDFLTAQAAAGIPADFIWLPHWEDIPDLFKAGLLAPLDRWLQVEEFRPLEAFAAEARRLVRYRAQTFALPLAVAPVVLAHNAVRFERANVAAPTDAWTWIDFIEAGKRLTEDTNGDGVPERWGFMAPGQFPEWLVFLLQEGEKVADLDTGEIGMHTPASLRALTAWDELGRVHGILPYGPGVSVAKLQGYHDFLQRGMHFSYFFNYLPENWRLVTPLPAGSQHVTPLVLTEALAMPDAAQGERAYEVLVPLAHWLGERRVMPATTAGWQYITRPDRDHFNLVFLESIQDALLQALTSAKASHVASSPGLSQALFNIVTYRLARDEVGIEQAIEQARNWLRGYVNE